MKSVGDQIVTSNGIGGISYFYSVSYVNSNLIDFVKV